MNRIRQNPRARAGAAIALVGAAGLLLAACNGSGSGSSATGSTGSSGGSNSSSGGSGGSSGGTAAVTSSASVPYPIAVGNTWVYKTSGLTGAADSRATEKMVAVKSVAGGTEVTMDSKISDLGAGSDLRMKFIFHSNGSISYPTNEFDSDQVKVLSGGIIWPDAALIASGHVNHSELKLEYTIGGQVKKLDAHIAVKGDGTQSVTVPAGTYNASIVQMTESEKFDGISVSIEVKTWLAANVGPVKSEVLSKSGSAINITDEQQLISFKKG